MSTQAHPDYYVAVQEGGSVASSAASSQIPQLWQASRAKDKDTRVFYNVDGATVVAVGTGKAKERKGGEAEENALKEQARRTAAVATHALKAAGSKSFLIDPAASAHSAAVGATLASFQWNLKTTTEAKAKLEPVEIGLLGEKQEPSLESEKAKEGRIQLDWETGKVYGEAQNFARTLMELPANRMTPTIFCETAQKQFEGVANVTMEAHDLAWAEENALKEQARRTAAVATHALKAAGSKSFLIDPAASAHSAAVGATLASFQWNLKTTTEAKAKLEPVEIGLLGEKKEPSLESEKAKEGRIQLDWETGKVYGEAQNFARTLMELPANRMTPTIFCETAQKQFEGVANVTMEAHDLAWAEEKKMGSFISVSRGSDEPLRFLELHYKGAQNKDEAPLAFVGKGITFDSGGISLKPGAAMKEMRADMGGAATTLAAAWAIAKLQIPINLVLCIPLTENMPSGKATKPGDIVVASNGVTIEVDNTDAEGRLALADALYYASSQFKPHTVVDVATLTGAMMIALGNQFTGVFTNSDSLWSELDAAGAAERDRVWRMPLDEGYYSQINGTGMDLCNTGGRLGGSCTAAIFLKRFVDGLIVDGSDAENQEDLIRWAHLDIAGTMDLAGSDGGYNLKGMSGRPVRTLVEFARRAVKA